MKIPTFGRDIYSRELASEAILDRVYAAYPLVGLST